MKKRVYIEYAGQGKARTFFCDDIKLEGSFYCLSKKTIDGRDQKLYFSPDKVQSFSVLEVIDKT